MTDEKQPRGNALLLATAFAFAAFMLFAKLGVFPLAQPDEGRNAEVAREMCVSGSWLVPTLDGLPYLDKPAFFFKCSALCFSAFGVTEGAARLPSALFALATILISWAFVRRAFGARAAALAVAIMATAPLFVALARIVIMDMTLTFFVIAAILCGAMAEEFDGRRRTMWIVTGAVMSGLATIVKGPVGFVVPLVVLIPWHIVEKRRGTVKRIFGWLPLATFWLVALPWFLLLCRARPDFAHYGLVEETFRRYTTGAMKREQPWYFYATIVFAGFAVWSLLLPEGIAAAWRGRAKLSRFDRLGIVWCIAVVGFFSLSKSKQPAYILSIATPMAFLVARIFDAAISNRQGSAARMIRRATVLLGALLLALCVALVVAQPATLGRWFHAAPNTMALMMPLIGPLRVALLALGVLAFAGFFLRSAKTSFVFFAAILPVLVVCGFKNIAAYTAHRSAQDLVAGVEKYSAGADVACLQIYPSALPFYLGRTITLFTDDAGETGSNYIIYTLKKSNPWPAPMVKIADLDRWLASRTNAVFLLTGKNRRDDIEKIAASRGVAPAWLTTDYIGVKLPPP